MTIHSPAVLLVQNDVAPGREAAFDAWYLADHMPDRVATPGFTRARRWHAIEGSPRDLSLYELDDMAVISSPAYLGRLAAPTAGTRSFMDAFVGMQRSVCEVRGAEGFADGGCSALLPILSPVPASSLDALLQVSAWRPDPAMGILARAVFRSDVAASHTDSVESRLRRGADQIVAAAVWVEAASLEQAQSAIRAAIVAAQSTSLVIGTPVLLRLVACFTKPP